MARRPTALPRKLPRRVLASSRTPVEVRAALSAMPSRISKARCACSWTPTAHTIPTISRSWPHRFSKGGRITFPGPDFSGGSSELHGGFDEWARLAGSSFITACINWRYGVRLSDSQNGFRAIRTDLLKSLKLRSRHTTIEQEMIVATLRAGKTLAEVPTHEHARKAGSSHILVWRDGPSYVLSLARLML